MMVHKVYVDRMLEGSHGYPYRAVCACGWQSRGYVAAHAAQTMVDEHAAHMRDNREPVATSTGLMSR